MRNSITTPVPTTDEWDDPLLQTIRPVLRAAIEGALEQELSALLGTARYQRAMSRTGYRNGTRVRGFGTPLGQVAIAVPRARVQTANGATQEWRSRALPRYGRRLQTVDQAIVRVYLSGTNQRKIAAALRPLLTGVALSKSAVSRLAGQLQVTREAWLSRRFDEKSFVYLYLDGFVVPVRRDGASCARRC